MSKTIFIKFCNIKLTTVIAVQQVAPSNIAFPPFLIILMRLLFKPIATIAIIMKNLLSSFKGINKSGLTPKLMVIVVIIDAIIKYNMNIGNVLFKLNELLLVFLFCFAVSNDKIKAIGIMARVLVNLTVTALSSVELPSPHILSHVAAAAVTDDVSLIAVPAKIPKASPLTVENPNILPKIGNKIAARD